MQAVKQESQQLLAVLLTISLELRGKPPQFVLEIGGRHGCGLSLHSIPHLQTSAAVDFADSAYCLCRESASLFSWDANTHHDFHNSNNKTLSADGELGMYWGRFS